MTVARITAVSGVIGSFFDIEVSGGAAPVIPEIVPTVTSVNGLPADALIDQLNSLWPVAPESTSSIVIQGTDLDTVTAIQFDFGCVRRVVTEGTWVDVDPVSGNFLTDSGKLIVPADTAVLDFNVDSPNQITIPWEELQIASLATVAPGAFSYFPAAMSLATAIFATNADTFVNGKTSNPVIDRPDYASDIWWNMRLWYGSGTHYIEPRAYINFRGPQSLRLVPLGDTQIGIGDAVQYAAWLTLTDGSSVNVTADISSWVSSDASVSIDVNGLATGVYVGSAIIYAFYRDQISNPYFDNSITVVDIKSGLAAMLISGNPNYTDGVSATTYLEGYPMWSGTNAAVYMTASTATPNPPKTGHAAANYNASTGIVNISSSASSGANSWNGTYNQLQTGWGTPWQNAVYGMYNTGSQYLTKGYAGATWTGEGSNDGIDWRLVSATGTAPQFVVTVDTGQPAMSASTNYYAQTVLLDGFSGYEFDSADTDVLGRIVHLIAYGDNAGAFANVTRIGIKNDFNEQSSTGLTFKILNSSEILCWLPHPGLYPNSWPLTVDNSRDMLFLFRNNDFTEFQPAATFRVFTGV